MASTPGAYLAEFSSDDQPLDRGSSYHLPASQPRGRLRPTGQTGHGFGDAVEPAPDSRQSASVVVTKDITGPGNARLKQAKQLAETNDAIADLRVWSVPKRVLTWYCAGTDARQIRFADASAPLPAALPGEGIAARLVTALGRSIDTEFCSVRYL